MGTSAITSGTFLDWPDAAGSSAASFALLFAAGARPSAKAIDRLLGGSVPSSGQVASISHRPHDAEGWVELLASGLAFDLAGLAPAACTDVAPPRHVFGLPGNMGSFALEAICLMPGEHVSAAAASLPLVRVMAGLAARLAQLDGVKAVAWLPAGSWMAPDYFQRIIANWLAGGAFPALGLTALQRAADGSVESVGLGYFIGQELRLESREGEDAAATVKLAVRAIDRLVQDGRVDGERRLTGPDGEALLARANAGGAVVRIWREA